MDRSTTLNRKVFVLAGLSAALAVFVTVNCGTGGQLQVLAEDVPTAHALSDVFNDPSLAAVLGKKPNFILDKYELMTKKAYQDLANQSGVYDLILDYNTGLATYTRNKYVYTLDEIKQRFPKQLNSAAKAKYRKDSGHDLAPPTTWEEFRNIARFFTKPDGSSFGVALEGDPYFIYYEWANVAYSMGGGVMKTTSDENGIQEGYSGHVCGGTRLIRPGAMSLLSSLARRPLAQRVVASVFGRAREGESNNDGRLRSRQMRRPTWKSYFPIAAVWTSTRTRSRRACCCRRVPESRNTCNDSAPSLASCVAWRRGFTSSV
jgi:hypothetical protein